MRLVIRDPGFDADHVELFISTRNADIEYLGANQARMNEMRDKLRGDSFYLDGPGDGITPLTRLDLSDGRVVWDLRADAGETYVELLVAVAFDANNTAVALAKMSGFDVPTNDTVATVLTLEPAMQMPPSEAPQPEGLRVWPWRKPNTEAAACLGIEYSDGREVKERKWLVPEDDPDCDEVQLECDKYLYHADYSQAAEPCVVPPVTSPIHLPCRAGTKVCEDDVSAGACVPMTPQYCLANALCDPDPCFLNVDNCLMTADSSLMTCNLPLQQDGTGCDIGTVGEGPLEVTLSTSNGLFPNGCQSVLFATLDSNAGLVTSPTTTVAGATFSIEAFTPTDCSFDLALVGQFDSSMLSGNRILLVLDVARLGGHLVVPVFIKLDQGGCADRQATCSPLRGAVSEFAGCGG